MKLNIIGIEWGHLVTWHLRIEAVSSFLGDRKPGVRWLGLGCLQVVGVLQSGGGHGECGGVRLPVAFTLPSMVCPQRGLERPKIKIHGGPQSPLPASNACKSNKAMLILGPPLFPLLPFFGGGFQLLK